MEQQRPVALVLVHDRRVSELFNEAFLALSAELVLRTVRWSSLDVGGYHHKVYSYVGVGEVANFARVERAPLLAASLVGKLDDVVGRYKRDEGVSHAVLVRTENVETDKELTCNGSGSPSGDRGSRRSPWRSRLPSPEASSG